MTLLFRLLLSLIPFLHLSFAATLPRAELRPLDGQLDRRATTTTTSSSTSTKVADSACTNGALTRQCWGNGYSIATDYDSNWPNTGKVVKYNLEITNTTLAPDGFSRQVFTVNGKIPGPTIIADWGDTLQITVKNSLTINGTSIHWHGLRQWKTNQMDGTNGITECPLAPGQTKTYTFLCTQFGTTWYHSHHSSQYTDGVIGTIIINGPATSNYDTDLGTMTVQDWFYKSATQITEILQSAPGAPPPGDNVLINGTNVSPSGGAYYRNTLTKGKKYRLRLINTGTDNGYKVHLDNHNFTVITADFVPIVPYVTDWLFIGIGQRYDVIINANQNVDSYWFHAVSQTPCGANTNTNALSIFSYSGATNLTPPANATSNAPASADCNDETKLVPYVKLNVPSGQIFPQSSDLDVGLAVVQTNGQNQVQWNLNTTSIDIQWDKPTLQYVMDGNTSYPRSLNVIELPNADTWSFWVIQEIPGAAPPIPHPIHLHGHDFYLLGAGTGTFTNSTTLNYTNPVRRDVAMLPGNGWLVIAFITDNPGAWLMHCHIAWHIGLGLGAQFLERKNDILSTLNIGADWKNTCTQWDDYYNNPVYLQEDSGL